MKNQKETIRKMVSYLNNPEKDGGFWLPNIQRSFVWREEQIERLFDSIMREYPISTLLVWKTRSEIRRRKFIDNYKSSLKLIDFYVPEESGVKLLVLDGQQRLQSLFIALKGSYEKKELYFDVLSGAKASPDDMKYRFKFRESNGNDPRWVKFKDLVFSPQAPNRLSRNITKLFEGLSEEQEETIENNISQMAKAFQIEESIVYQELDSVDNPELYSEDDVVEIFIRANSGGTPLGKSDLLFSLLTASWEDADERMGELLEELNKTGYQFKRDFILKCCLSLLKKGASYDVAKFRDESTREQIIFNWDNIASAIMDVKDFLLSKTFIRSDKSLSSYLGFIPLIYFRYHYKSQWNSASGINDYILRTLIAGSFSGNPDSLIDQCTREVERIKGFQIDDIFGVIKANGRSLEITRETILEQQYGSKNIHLIFNLWYKDFNYHPSFTGGAPSLDHIFPQSALKSVKEDNPIPGGRKLLKYKQYDRDQIANLMLLRQEENGAGGKGSTLPIEWFADKSEEYLDLHLIPKDRGLWELERFEEFIKARKELIERKFSYLLIKG